MNLPLRLVNRLFDAAFSRPLEPLWRKRLQGRVLCLLYHRVGEPGQYPFLDRAGSPSISPSELESDVSFWAQRGATFGTFRDLRNGWFPGPSEIGVVVCFDDGFRSTYELGLPVLERVEARGTVFQISSIIGSDQFLWEHRLYHLLADPRAALELAKRATNLLGSMKRDRTSLTDRFRFELDREALNRLLDDLEREIRNKEQRHLARELYPDEAMVLEAAKRHHEIGSHGHTHQPRRRLSKEEFSDELRKSRDLLGEILGEAPSAYSHPFGDHLPGDPALLQPHFQQAAIVEPRPIRWGDTPLELPRCSWPGSATNRLRWRRWLLTGGI